MIGEARNILFSWEAMQILEESIKNSGKNSITILEKFSEQTLAFDYLETNNLKRGLEA